MYVFIMHCQLSFKKDFANLYMCACLAYFMHIISRTSFYKYLSGKGKIVKVRAKPLGFGELWGVRQGMDRNV